MVLCLVVWKTQCSRGPLSKSPKTCKVGKKYEMTQSILKQSWDLQPFLDSSWDWGRGGWACGRHGAAVTGRDPSECVSVSWLSRVQRQDGLLLLGCFWPGSHGWLPLLQVLQICSTTPTTPSTASTTMETDTLPPALTRRRKCVDPRTGMDPFPDVWPTRSEVDQNICTSM